MRLFALVLLLALPAQAQDRSAITIVERREVRLAAYATLPTHSLALTLVHFKEGGWDPDLIIAAARQAAPILAQCGVALSTLDLVLVGAPAPYRYYRTPVSRALARALPLPRPAIYFVAGTRQNPAFDAEAIGRGNSGPRPELQDTVWIALGTRDVGLVLAHEVAHVLMDSGEHSDEPGNLMREDTAPGNVRLTELQCARLRDVGSANGLLRPR